MNAAAGWIIAAAVVTQIAQAADGCRDRVYGPNCSLTCGQHCKASTCVTDDNRGTFTCSSGCIDGWTGLSCDRKCLKGCKSCDQATSTCAECKSGCCGKNCGQVCSDSDSCQRCIDSSCHQCHYGWYGRDCNAPCPEHCVSGCSKTSGECDHQCVIGYHGNYCSKSCTTTCMEGCNQTDGSCNGGCHVGWHGRFCNQSCSNTCIDSKCYQISGECAVDVLDNVHKFTLPHCKPTWTGHGVVKSCRAGCESGWRGARCDQRCPDECYSCSRYPGGQMCVYRREVLVVHTYGNDHDESGRFEVRMIYALLLVIPPFLIVGTVQLLCISWERYKRNRDIKRRIFTNEECEKKINTV